MLEDIKNAILFIYGMYMKPYIEIIVISLLLLIIAGVSIVVLGKDNPVEKEIEHIVEEEISEIKPTSS